ncbi:ABC2 homolog 12, ARABIDOPSIS THALIANA ABC TRANSPORTER HOMOLOG 12, ATP-binding cassette B29 [Hibiscus trionum]|uniref:ABC2 homolog 12, ARABIDOPSIS THALIANA ABC TRANSPORTER HOMOLOG 12, ATP-binding cassette B29 n=1 Tax=Hibiscus trionum TaxID=183268 RepID=A0A9W7MKE1_HIBTR|nr:ABC2 homolog 12, ARABIDOPSIS THALIANA ABC TRANSPORTER HOMOLOG 12, ATP-binding cassette B29 [Hibiscus trionum]
MSLHSLLFLSPPSQPPLPPPFLHLRPHQKGKPIFLHINSPSKPPLKPLNSIKIPLNLQTIQTPLSKALETLTKIKPFLQTNHQPILLGWLCSSVSVFSLSQIIPRVGSFSSNLINTVSFSKLRDQSLLLGVLVLVKLVACYWQQAFLWEASLKTVYKMRVFVFQKVLERELDFFEGCNGVSCGDIAYRITAEAADVADTVFALLNTIVPNTLQLFAMAMQMLVISPYLSLITAMVIPFMAFVIAYLGERLRKISKRSHLSIATLASYLNEVLPAIFFVKANNGELSEHARFQRLAYTDFSRHLAKKKMKALIPQIIQIIYFGVLCMICVGSLVVSRGSFDGSSMVSFVTSLVFLVEPIQGVGKAYNELKQGEPAIERLFDLTKVKSKVIEKPDAIDLSHVKGEVKFCDVSFKYAGNMPLVLDGLNFTVRAGETVALIGQSGGGKTTLVKLLLRLYEPSSGSILIDSHNIQNIRLESLRRHVGLVSQDTMLFSGTVAENIGYRDRMTNIDMEKVELAARIANADEFIRTLPEGYRSQIGPRGSLLSGGQKQRLAIARAVYQNSFILVLDEATSALDSKSEVLVREAVERLMENHTVLVIAHRLETILMADRIFLLENGKLEELTRSTFVARHRESLLSAGAVI